MVTLKDRFKIYTIEHEKEQEELWYQRAFGKMRNMMSVELSFTPPAENFPPGKFMFFAKLNYKIFEELKEEFKD